MIQLQELEQKIRQAIPELKEEFDAFEDGSIDRDMITPIMLNHVIDYQKRITGKDSYWWDNGWVMKYPFLKDQSPELINFLNELK
jgi:hypothetical protein